MSIADLEEQKTKFKKYTDDYISKSYEMTRGGYVDKQSHSFFVLDEAMAVDTIFTQYNQSFKNLLALESLFHDVGRFEQLRVTGSFRDNELKKYYPHLEDHGDLGALLMRQHGILNDLTPNSQLYDEQIMNVIRLHSKINQDLLDESIYSYISAFKNYDLESLLLSSKSSKELEMLTRINTAIVQDVDRLDIFRKIVRGIWLPNISSEPIDSELLELFKKGKLPSINEIKTSGKWNSNVGHLVRMSFISQMNLVPVLQIIRNEKLIDELFKASGNDIVLPAYEYAKEQLDMAIESSDDGIMVRKRKYTE